MPAALRSQSRTRRPAPSPESDPRFKKVIDQLKGKAAQIKRHPPAAKKAAEASAAAKGPPNEKAAGAKSKQVDKIKEAPTKKPEPSSFLALLRAEIQKAMPQTLGDTEKFMKGGSSGQLKGSLKGNVSQQKDEAAGGVKTAASQTPSEGGVAAKEAKSIPPEPAPPSPTVDGGEAMPAPKPAEEVSLQDSKQDAEAQMKEAEVTPQQLQKANDPRFSAVLTAKETVGRQADTAPGQYRAAETVALGQAAAKARGDARTGAARMLAVKGGAGSAVLARQNAAKARDEKARADVTNHIIRIYNDTKAKVEAKLNSLETDVAAIFDPGVDSALKAMTDYIESRLLRYKLERYLSIPGVGLAYWIRDQAKGLPDEVNVFYDQGSALFRGMMDRLVVRVADLVERRLKEAKDEVAKGQAEIKAFVAKQPKDLQAVARDAQKEVAGKFEDLERGIEDKKNQLAQQLAEKYKEAFDKAEAARKKIQDENKGLIAAFTEKLGEIIKALAEFKARLMAAVRQSEDAIKLILADPVGFLGNLLAALKQGFNQFAGNIWTHLKKGFMTWLFGALSSAGIAIPSDLSPGSILKLVLSVLGLTWERARAEAVKMLGPTAVAVIEKLVQYIQAFWQGGPAALWAQLQGDLSNLKAMVIDAIQDWLITTIVKKAVAKVVSMFNPVGAIVQAVMMIVSVVQFVVERAAQILSFVEAVISSIASIARGNIGGAASWIENALGRLVPVVIGLLASLIGLGGLGAKIREFVTKAGDAVWGAIRKFLKRAIDFVKKMWGKLTGKDKKEKGKKEKGKEQPNEALTAAVQETEKAVDDDPLLENIAARLPAIRAKHRLRVLTVKKVSEDSVRIEAEINPRKSADRKLSNEERLIKCKASGKHGKRVETFGHGNPQAAIEKAKQRIEGFRKDIEGYKEKLRPLENIEIPRIERLARARGVPEDKIPGLTAAARKQVEKLKEQIMGAESNIKGIEHEEKVAKVDKAVLRNVKVRCVICRNYITELDQIADKNVILEAKATAAAINVEKVVLQQKVMKQLYGETARYFLALPRDLEVLAAVENKFRVKGVPMPPVRMY